ncbi:MAG: hypothetical protein WC130_03645 [Kiritimatiellia bacterium]
MTNTVPNTEIDKHQNSYALRAPAYTDCVVLDSATVAASYDVPEDATHIFFSATADFYAQYFTDTLSDAVTNGAFAADTDWTKGTDWTIAGGVGVASSATSANLTQTAAITLIEGQAYRVTGDVTRSAGGVFPIVGGTQGTEVTATGAIDEIIVAGATQIIGFDGNSFTGTVDNFTVTPVAIVPTASLTGGVSPELNPTQRLVKGINRISLIAPSAGDADVVITMNVTR